MNVRSSLHSVFFFFFFWPCSWICCTDRAGRAGLAGRAAIASSTGHISAILAVLHSSTGSVTAAGRPLHTLRPREFRPPVILRRPSTLPYHTMPCMVAVQVTNQRTPICTCHLFLVSPFIFLNFLYSYMYRLNIDIIMTSYCLTENPFIPTRNAVRTSAETQHK